MAAKLGRTEGFAVDDQLAEPHSAAVDLGHGGVQRLQRRRRVLRGRRVAQLQASQGFRALGFEGQGLSR